MAAASAILLRSSDASTLHSLAANYDRAVRNPLALAADGPPPEIVQLWREQRSPASSSSEWSVLASLLRRSMAAAGRERARALAFRSAA